ncbi:MAG: VWA domain-containing protein [Bacteroidales bacterium]|nr:VWA domain-containing protein [Bacteroidales bacterium]
MAMHNVGTKHPALLLILIDNSGSTRAGDIYKKIFRAVYSQLEELYYSCAVFGRVKERVHVIVICYNSAPTTLFEGGIQDIKDLILDRYTSENLFGDIPDASPGGQTDMAKAFAHAGKAVRVWLDLQKAKGVPVYDILVENATDGYPEVQGLSESEARSAALREASTLRSVKTDGEDLVLFNIHYDPSSGAPTVLTPLSDDGITDPDVQFLYDASSVLPASWTEYVGTRDELDFIGNGSRAMVSNLKDESVLVHLFHFGTITMVSSGRPKETPRV